MLSGAAGSKVYVAAEPVDLRRGHDGLCALVHSQFKVDPLAGHLFVFVGRRDDRVKVLFWDCGGFVLYYKRLARGRFRMPRIADGAQSVALDGTELTLVLFAVVLTLVAFTSVSAAYSNKLPSGLLEDGIGRVGLLGTRFTMEKRFYIDGLAARGLDVVVPDIGITNLNAIIYEELVKGIVRDESRRIYVDAITRLKARGAEAVILGCTEIGMLIDDSVSPLPTYDTTELHAKALVAEAMDD